MRRSRIPTPPDRKAKGCGCFNASAAQTAPIQPYRILPLPATRFPRSRPELCPFVRTPTFLTRESPTLCFTFGLIPPHPQTANDKRGTRLRRRRGAYRSFAGIPTRPRRLRALGRQRESSRSPHAASPATLCQQRSPPAPPARGAPLHPRSATTLPQRGRSRFIRRRLTRDGDRRSANP